MRQVSESLAGRAVYYVIDPLTPGEINQAPPPQLIQKVLSGRKEKLSQTCPRSSPNAARLATANVWIRMGALGM